jgi:hypothetical protein
MRRQQICVHLGVKALSESKDLSSQVVEHQNIAPKHFMKVLHLFRSEPG